MGGFGLADVQGGANGVEYEFSLYLGNDLARILGDVRGGTVAAGGKKRKNKRKLHQKMFRTTCGKFYKKVHYGNMCPNRPPEIGMLTLTNIFI